MLLRKIDISFLISKKLGGERMNMFNLIPIVLEVDLTECGGQCKGCEGCKGEKIVT